MLLDNNTVQQEELDDPFCEAQLWKELGMANNKIANPMGTTTAFLMLIMAFVNNFQKNHHLTSSSYHHSSKKIPRLFVLCKASLALTGIGTIFFHAFKPEDMSHAHFNHGLCDWFPIIMLCSNILILYLDRLMPKCGIRGEFGWVLLIAIIMIWIFVLVVGMDSDTNAYFSHQMGTAGSQGQYGTILNAVLLLPLALVLAYTCAYRFEFAHTKYLMVSLSLTVAMWLVDAYLCRQHPWLSVLHAIYHVTIAYSFIYAACLGVSLDNRQWMFTLNKWGWPILVVGALDGVLYDDDFFLINNNDDVVDEFLLLTTI